MARKKQSFTQQLLSAVIPCVLACFTVSTYAQSSVVSASIENQSYTTLNEAELAQLLAPIALYPDGLLGHTLYAATRPDQVSEAANFMRNQARLSGAELTRVISLQGWLPSIQALAQVPSVLGAMDTHPDWVKRLGLAHKNQEFQVLATVQALRHKAYKRGNLLSNNEQRVILENGAIVINSTNSGTLYVPYYDAKTIYGDWETPAYPPETWQPSPEYASKNSTQYVKAGIIYAASVPVAPKLFWAWRPNWKSAKWRNALSSNPARELQTLSHETMPIEEAKPPKRTSARKSVSKKQLRSAKHSKARAQSHKALKSKHASKKSSSRTTKQKSKRR